MNKQLGLFDTTCKESWMGMKKLMCKKIEIRDEKFVKLKSNFFLKIKYLKVIEM